MARTLGYHVVISGYGLWLPGDARGHWSEAWDEQLGYIEPHTLHAGDPVRQQMAAERQRHPTVRLDAAMQAVAAETIGRCQAESDWNIAAASIEATHTHLLLTYTTRDVDNAVKWLKDQITKAIHRQRPTQGRYGARGAGARSCTKQTLGSERDATSNATTSAAAPARAHMTSSWIHPIHKAATGGRAPA